MNLLPLDPGTRTGWALTEPGSERVGVLAFDIKRNEGMGGLNAHFPFRL